MIDLDDLEALARAAGENEVWCLHPNGLSVWTGTEYDSANIEQVMVARGGVMTDESSFKRMMLVAELWPGAVIELVDRARGLSDVKLVHGPEDSDEVCVACERSTSGHTHAECYAHGKSDGKLDENIRCASALAALFGFDYTGDHFDEVLDLVRATLAEEARSRDD
jgi:hypothetical protein